MNVCSYMKRLFGCRHIDDRIFPNGTDLNYFSLSLSLSLSFGLCGWRGNCYIKDMSSLQRDGVTVCYLLCNVWCKSSTIALPIFWSRPRSCAITWFWKGNQTPHYHPWSSSQTPANLDACERSPACKQHWSTMPNTVWINLDFLAWVHEQQESKCRYKPHPR